jgi:hypothetical protein
MAISIANAFTLGNTIANPQATANRAIVAGALTGILTGAVTLARALGWLPDGADAWLTPDTVATASSLLAALVLIVQSAVAAITNPHAGTP